MVGATPDARARGQTGTIVYVSSEEPGDEPPESAPAPRAVFRMPRTAVVVVVFAMFCATPFAWSGALHATVYLIPVAVLVWIFRTRTVAGADGITVRTVFGRRDLDWSELKGFAISERAKVSAVLTDESKVPLPTVRTRHLPVLAAVSGGRVTDPTAQQQES